MGIWLKWCGKEREAGPIREREALAGVTLLRRLEGEGRWVSGTSTKCLLLQMNMQTN